MDVAGWEARYASETDAPERNVTPLLEEFASGLKPGRALDLACGTGRNALWLARNGWEVTAIDASANAIAKLRQYALAEGVQVTAEVADLEEPVFTLPAAKFDLVLMLFYLQRDLFERAKNSVKDRGTLIAIAHTVEFSEKPTPHRLQPGELNDYFNGWETLHYREGKPNDEQHRRAVAEIVARRP